MNVMPMSIACRIASVPDSSAGGPYAKEMPMQPSPSAEVSSSPRCRRGMVVVMHRCTASPRRRPASQRRGPAETLARSENTADKPLWRQRRMIRSFRTLTALVMLCAIASSPPAASAQGQPDSAALLAAQRDAMTRFAYMDGVWRGPASTVLPSGQRADVTQTERIGPFLGGSIKVIEGRGYNADGTVGFNAFGIISYQPAQQTYTLHSYALGYAGDFIL